MSNYWRGINVEEIEKVSGIGGSFSRDKDESYTYFKIKMKDGNEITLYFEDRNAYKYRPQLMKIYNELNGITEHYWIKNEAHAIINGEIIHFGARCDSWLGESKYFTLLEIEKLRKEFKIKDDRIRQLAFITLLEIKGNKVVRGELSDTYKEQLEYLGYKTDLLMTE